MKRVVVLADGEFPVHETPLSILKQSEYLVCCDGAAKKCIEYGYNPDAIVGDMDSLDDEFKSRYKSIIHQSAEERVPSALPEVILPRAK